MGIYTTLTVSRQAAIRKLAQLSGSSLTNQELEDILEAYLKEKTLYNFIVVDDHEYRTADHKDDGTLEYLDP